MVRLTEDVDAGVGGPPPFHSSPEVGDYVFDGNYNRKMMENQYGFRLQELNHSADLCGNGKDTAEADTGTSISGHSTYKQRIDSMFDDSRSQVSDRSKDFANGRTASSSLSNLLDDYEEETGISSAKNTIQEKIEKMFEEISLNGFQRKNSYHYLRSHNIYSSREDVAGNDFKVVYLGSKCLVDKCVSLVTLQEPLKDLYLEHRKLKTGGHGNLLTISKEGLKIKNHETVTLNPFPTIAVWASVKFSYRKIENGTEFAFLPLIKDPDGIDKNILFKQLTENEKALMDNSDEENITPPIFSVVMKNSSDKMLECHAFICSSSEEAIVIAANLYQALMKKMKRPRKLSSKTDTDATVTSDSDKDGKVTDAGAQVRKKSPPPVPNRPPRKISRDRQPSEEVITQLKETIDEAKMKAEKNMSRSDSEISNILSSEPPPTIRRSASERRNGPVESVTADGDILTKVAIPRSRSFLNANGPLTRYSRRYKMSAHSDGEVSSPLGFNELFHEFRQNEGLESMDDILNAIIDAEGMSFNDLKPIYKEFLLKLAVTLTKDELFQRSKMIMRRQKKKNRSRSLRKKSFVSATGLRKVFRKTASKLGKPKPSRPATLEFTSVVFQSGGKNFETSTTSTGSSCVKKKEARRKASSKRRSKKTEARNNTKMSSTSEDSDCFLRRNGNESGGCPNRSSSGYFSCSECSYDSEHCTCTSADKCYCTLGTKRGDKMSVSSCGCDTDSCADSEKCYCSNHKQVLNLSDVKAICQTPHLHQNNKIHNANCPNYSKCKKHCPTIIEQLKEQGFAASDSSLSRAASPTTAWRNNEEKVKGTKECLKASKSLEFLQMRPQRSESRQQIHECPPPPSPEPTDTQKNNYVEGTRHYCYHGSDVNATTRRREPPNSYRPTRRQYSSMRARLPQVDSTSRFRSKVFSSMRAKYMQEDIMSHVLFPDRNGSTTSSLRFTRRMDVYNSFQGRRCIERQGSYIDLLNQIQTRYQSTYNRKDPVGFGPTKERSSNFDNSQVYFSSGGSDNFKKLDYELFTASARSETSATISSNGSERKVLVVSARDPKGKVLYMGASSRGEKNMKNVVKDKNGGSASEALSVKKSAEIAALFSDVSTKIRSSRPASVRSSIKTHSRTGSYRLMNMENTLGYLP